MLLLESRSCLSAEEAMARVRVLVPEPWKRRSKSASFFTGLLGCSRTVCAEASVLNS
jgi:hypothetical protein